VQFLQEQKAARHPEHKKDFTDYSVKPFSSLQFNLCFKQSKRYEF